MKQVNVMAEAKRLERVEGRNEGAKRKRTLEAEWEVEKKGKVNKGGKGNWDPEEDREEESKSS